MDLLRIHAERTTGGLARASCGGNRRAGHDHGRRVRFRIVGRAQALLLEAYRWRADCLLEANSTRSGAIARHSTQFLELRPWRKGPLLHAPAARTPRALYVRGSIARDGHWPRSPDPQPSFSERITRPDRHAGRQNYSDGGSRRDDARPDTHRKLPITKRERRKTRRFSSPPLLPDHVHKPEHPVVQEVDAIHAMNQVAAGLQESIGNQLTARRTRAGWIGGAAIEKLNTASRHQPALR